MRKIELLRVKKYDIDFKNRKITIQSAKNHKTRIINIDIKIAVMLYFHCRKLNDDDYIFNFSSSYVSYEFHRRMKKANFRKITLHDIRHIYASLLLSKLKNSANSIIFVQHQLRTCYSSRNT